MHRAGMATQGCIVMLWQHSHMGPMGPHGPQVRLLLCGAISKSSQNLAFSHFWCPKWVKKKLRLRGRDPPSQNRAAILRLGAVSMSKMVARRPIWWQKGVIWGPLGFRAQLAHPCAGGGGRRAVAPTLTPLVSLPPPPHTHTQDCYPALRGKSHPAAEIPPREEGIGA